MPGAALIGFDEFTEGSYSSLYTGGVTITDLQGGDMQVISGGNLATGYVSPVNCIAAQSWDVGQGLLFEFDYLVSNVSIVGGDAGANDTDRWSMEAFDISGNSIGFVETGLFANPDPVNPLVTTFGVYRTLSLDVSGISSVKVTQLAWGSAWDNLSFDEAAPVPEPASILLLGSGLFGLVGYNRKRFVKRS